MFADLVPRPDYRKDILTASVYLSKSCCQIVDDDPGSGSLSYVGHRDGGSDGGVKANGLVSSSSPSLSYLSSIPCCDCGLLSVLFVYRVTYCLNVTTIIAQESLLH